MGTELSSHLPVSSRSASKGLSKIYEVVEEHQQCKPPLRKLDSMPSSATSWPQPSLT
jgi:hypothetical protein